MPPSMLRPGSVHSEHCSWPPSLPSGSAAQRIPVTSARSPFSTYLPHVHCHAATVPSRLAGSLLLVWPVDLSSSAKPANRCVCLNTSVAAADVQMVVIGQVNPLSSACSLSLPELRVRQSPEEVPAYKHRPQHSSSSGEEGAFRPESLAASRFSQLRHAPLIGAQAKGTPWLMWSRPICSPALLHS